MQREYPHLTDQATRPTRSISFIVVRFSDEYLYNFKKSRCIQNPLNQTIVVDNRANMYFDGLSEAMAAGIAQAQHDLIVVAHEDVLLPDGWQARFEMSLNELEKHDSEWAILGSVGWGLEGEIVGHWSDPHQYLNTFIAKCYEEVERLDEQILVFSRLRLPELDLELPGIHHIGRDLLQQAEQRGYRNYAINAPTIHKYADAYGKLILERNDSSKITDRAQLTYKANRAVCDEYIGHKWPGLRSIEAPENLSFRNTDAEHMSRMDSPLVLLGSGGSGTRLLSFLCQDIGVWLGNEISRAGDSLDMVMCIYQGIFEKFQCKSSWQKSRTVPRLRFTANRMLLTQPDVALWGFKLPENLFLLPEIKKAFPNARFLQLIRDPLTRCLRRTHMTARLDNHIGRVTLPLAYDFVDRPRSMILEDSSALHMAYTAIHQHELIKTNLLDKKQEEFMTVRFEDIITEPETCLQAVSEFLGSLPHSDMLVSLIDQDRVRQPNVQYPPDIEQTVQKILAPIRRELGYI